MKKNNKLNKEAFTNWLNTAIPFSVWLYSNKEHIMDARDYIFKHIGEKYRYSRYKSMDQEMMMDFVHNLWWGFCVGCPIRISKSANLYSHNDVIGKAHFTYDRMERIFEKLRCHGYMLHIPGFYNEEENRRYQTRIWASEKLIRLFVHGYKFQIIGDIYPEKTVKLIQLRDEIEETRFNKATKKKYKVKLKIPVGFDDTDTTLVMRDSLERYNKLAEESTISLKFEAEDIITPNFLNELLMGISSGAITIIESTLDYKNPKEHPFYRKDLDLSDIPDTSVITDIPESRESVYSGLSIGPELMIDRLSYKEYQIPVLTVTPDLHTGELIYPGVLKDINPILTRVTHSLYNQQWQGFQKETALFLYISYIKKTLSLAKMEGRNDKDKKKRRMKMMASKRPLIDFGIRHLEFEINKKALHRVFNRASLDFDKGGRFYGPSYQGMPPGIRKRIKINGNNCVEVDYSGHHIRMLYHQLSLEYTKDPYNIGKKSERSKYKLVSLISINSTKKEAPGAIRDILTEGNIPFGSGKGCITKLMDKYKDYHEPIKEFLFSGAGIDLQNTDSEIMDDILAELTNRGILGLPIHDSVIVEEQHQALLKRLMIEKYQERMKGFTPILKVA